MYAANCEIGVEKNYAASRQEPKNLKIPEHPFAFRSLLVPVRDKSAAHALLLLAAFRSCLVVKH